MELIGYCRVAKASQKRPVSPGLEAQRLKVQRLADAIAGRDGVAVVVSWYTEIEAHSETRPQLARAVTAARNRDAVVVVAQLYPLARDAAFLAHLATLEQLEYGHSNQSERKPFKGFLFADLPRQRHRGALVEGGALRCWAWLTDLAADLAQLEQQGSGRRTREALAVARDRGVQLGGTRPGTLQENARTKAAALERAEQLRSVLAPMQAQGASLRAMAQAVAAAGTTTAKGQPLSPSQIKRHLERLGLLAG